MGPAIWLFGWLCSRQTRPNGLVHGGTCFTYKKIADDMGETPRRIERWLWKLRHEKYVEVKHGNYKRLVIRILNQKKYSDVPVRQKTADMTVNHIHPKTADRIPKNGGFNGEESIEERKSPPLPPNENRVGGFRRRARRPTKAQTEAHVGSGPDVPAATETCQTCGEFRKPHTMLEAARKLHYPNWTCATGWNPKRKAQLDENQNRNSKPGELEITYTANHDERTARRSETEKDRRDEGSGAVVDFETKGMIQ